MTLDERCVVRWILLSEAERATSPVGPPYAALMRIADRLRYRQPVSPGIRKHEKDIMRIAQSLISG